MSMIQKRKKGTRSARAGFTLVETIIVIVIIIVVTAIAVPAFQKMAINGNLRAAARDIMSDFALLKQKAMAENTTFSIIFDVAHNNYTIQGSGTTQIKTPEYFASDVVITSASFDIGSTIRFHTRGTTSFGTVVLTNGRNSTATITTNITGRIHVYFDIK
jgi:Tfp pilus assembly protein FimT